jgi:iron complex outermembrane receptor protein
MKQLILWMLSLLLIGGSAMAQQRTTVQGAVVDAQGEPVIGVSVVEKGTTVATSTGADGKFTLSVSSPEAVLVFNYLGYKPLERPASAVGATPVVLEEDQMLLDEVVVVGYGAMKKTDLTGSVVAVKPDELNKGNQITAQDALVGKIAGVHIVPGSGAPGTGATIRIRGGASLSASNDPLIIIDGVPVDNSGIEGASNVIGTINPNDIESFTVVKDASATAIYGSRASNGVIIISTKKGGGEKMQLNYTNRFSLSTIMTKMDVLTAEEFKAFVPTVSGVPENPTFGDVATDWQDQIYQVAFGHDHNLSLSGRLLKNAPYRVHLGYTDQNGVIKTNSYNRYTTGVGIAPRFFDAHLTVDLNVKLSYENNHKVSSSVVGSAWGYDPTRPVKTGSSTWETDPGLGYYIWTDGNGKPMNLQSNNPVAVLDLQKDMNKVTRSIGNAAIDYKIHGLEDLHLNLNTGYDVLTSKNSNDIPELAGMMYTGNKSDGTGLVERSTQDKRNYLLDLYANYTHNFADKHALNVTAGYGWQHFWKRYNTTANDPQGNEISSPKHYETEYFLLSLFGRLNYIYDNRYMLTSTLRSDASSRFHKDNRWGLFPSVALGWRVSQESFLRDSHILSDLKLRLSYGVTGQQDIINDYPYMSTFTVSYPEASYQFGNTWYNTYRPNGYDPNIKWEETTTYNAGIDYGFLNNRLYGSIDYYKRFTGDLLNQINVISGTNYAPVIITNIGEMENYGWEFAINAVPIRASGWEWAVGLNYTYTQSKITHLNVFDSENTYVPTGSIDATKHVQVFMVNQTPYTFYLAKQAYDDAGKPLEGQYIQPDGSVSTTETRYATDKSALPTSLLGFNTHLSYGNWELGVSAHGAFGNYVYNYLKAKDSKESVYSSQIYSNILQSTRDEGFEQQRLYSDYFLEEGAFFRIDNVSLAYTFPKLWSSASSLNLSIGVQNLAIITKYSGIDPELFSGIDGSVYQRPRIYTFSMNFTF